MNESKTINQDSELVRIKEETVFINNNENRNNNGESIIHPTNFGRNNTDDISNNDTAFGINIDNNGASHEVVEYVSDKPILETYEDKQNVNSNMLSINTKDETDDARVNITHNTNFGIRNNINQFENTTKDVNKDSLYIRVFQDDSETSLNSLRVCTTSNV